VVCLAFLLLPDLSALGQPVVQAEVVAVQPTGGVLRCGRHCSCPRSQVDLELAGGGSGRLVACAGRYDVGSRLAVRRTRGHDGTVQLPGPGLWPMVLIAVGVSAAWHLLPLRRQALARRRRTAGTPSES
jgi:hypothetical protein